MADLIRIPNPINAMKTIPFPFFDYNEDNIKTNITVENNAFVIYINHDANVNLQRALLGLATIYPYYEEVDIWSDDQEQQLTEDKIDLCEIHSVKDDDIQHGRFKSILYNSHGKRLDIFVTRQQAMEAYENLKTLYNGEASRIITVKIFDVLQIRLV